jgi:hypothetical protein
MRKIFIKFITMKRVLLFVLQMLLISCLYSSAQRLSPFTSILNSAENNGKPELMPYGRTISFFDCLEPGIKADTVMDGKKWFFIYFQLQSEVQEIGIRFISPVPIEHFPFPGDVVTGAYDSLSQSKGWFDPVIMLQQDAISHGSDSTNQMLTGWKTLASNNDSEDAPPQPDGKNSNAVVRIINGPYTSGRYRILFGPATSREPLGCFLLQLGTFPALREISVFRDGK